MENLVLDKPKIKTVSFREVHEELIKECNFAINFKSNNNMCLKVSKNAEIEITSKPIFVYKSIDRSNYSKFYNFEYIKDVLNKHVEIKIDAYDSIYDGEIFEVDRGYHSWKEKMGNSLFVIPAGAKYIEGIQHNDEIGFVSSNIIYLGNIKKDYVGKMNTTKIYYLKCKFILKSWLKKKFSIRLK